MEPIPHIAFKADRLDRGFELLDMADLLFREKKPGDHDPFKPHRVTFFIVMIIEAGEVEHTLDFRPYHLKAGDALMISKGQIHHFDKTQEYIGKMVLFTEEFLLQYLSASTLGKVNRLYNYHLNTAHYQIPEANVNLIRQLTLEQKQNPVSIFPHIFAALIAIYLLKLEGANQQNNVNYAAGHHYATFAEFNRRVEEGYAQSRNAKDYADRLAISYKHLNEVCKRFTHKTAKAFIDDYVALEIKRFLSSSALSTKEIGFACGFDEPTNFVKYFKKIVGVTPAAFRKQFSVRKEH